MLLQSQRGFGHPLTAAESPLVEKLGEGTAAACPAGAVWVRVFLQSLQVPAASWGCGGKGQRGLRSAPSTVLWAAASFLQNLLDRGCLLTEGESACFSPTGQLIKGSSWKGAKAQVGTCEPLC